LILSKNEDLVKSKADCPFCGEKNPILIEDLSGARFLDSIYCGFPEIPEDTT